MHTIGHACILAYNFSALMQVRNREICKKVCRTNQSGDSDWRRWSMKCCTKGRYTLTRFILPSPLQWQPLTAKPDPIMKCSETCRCIIADHRKCLKSGFHHFSCVYYKKISYDQNRASTMALLDSQQKSTVWKSWDRFCRFGPAAVRVDLIYNNRSQFGFYRVSKLPLFGSMDAVH